MATPRKRRKLRKMTWTLIVWTVVCLIWVVAGVHSADNQSAQYAAQHCQGFVQSCVSAGQAGSAIGAGLVVGVWFIGFIVLSLVWFMTRPREVIMVQGGGADS
jgi:hypothetical protein